MQPRRAGMLALSACAWLACPRAHAQIAPAPASREVKSTASDAPLDDSKPPLGIFPSDSDTLVDPRMLRSWGAAPARPFLATTVDVGFVYFRPRLSLGYGRPFTSWLGVEANPIVTSFGFGAYAGARFELPYVDLRVGPRYFSPFNHTYLNNQPSYRRLDLESSVGKKANATSYEAELDAALPVGPGSVLVRGSVSYVTGIPANQSVFEETLHVMVQPPWVWRVRAGYAFRLGAHGQHSLGVVADVLDVPRREDSTTVRAGPILRLVLSRRVEVRGSFVITLVSPDRLGLVGGDFTELGVRYRWATEP